MFLSNVGVQRREIILVTHPMDLLCAKTLRLVNQVLILDTGDCDRADFLWIFQILLLSFHKLKLFHSFRV